MCDHLIATTESTRPFGKFSGVESLDLRVGKAEVLGPLRPDGAGKTTTIKMLTTLLPLT
jgi:ABC-2 type transport system ATP-binding protein